MCYPLYGHELDERTTPLEAGLGIFVALEKREFVGREALAAQKAAGVSRKCVAFSMIGKSPPPRPHYSIFSNGAKVGEVSSGTQSPSLGIGIGMGFVASDFAAPGTELEIEIRGKRFPAGVARRPLYHPPAAA
jgi:aminomethyltransferase